MEPPKLKDITLLVFGKIGNGKSATGNSILRKNVFGKNQELAVESSEFQGYQIHVVDGLSVDTKLDEDGVEELHEMAEKAMEKYSHFHAIIIVMKYGSRFTQADKDVFQSLRRTFGKDVVSNCGVVVLTNGDVFESDQEDQEDKRITFEQWCSQQTGFFREIMEECKDRIVLFNNREKLEEKRAEQLEELLKHVNSVGCVEYTKEDFEKAKESRKLQKLEAEEERHRSETRRQVAEIKAELRDTDSIDKLETGLDKVKDVRKELEEMYTNLQDGDIRNQAMQVMRSCVQPVAMLESELKDKLELARLKVSMGKAPDSGAGRDVERGVKRKREPEAGVFLECFKKIAHVVYNHRWKIFSFGALAGLVFYVRRHYIQPSPRKIDFNIA